MIKKKTILLGTLIPLSVAGICTSVVIPLSSCNHNDGWITLKSSNDVKKYLDEHKQVHNDGHDWSDGSTQSKAEANAYFWNRQNYTTQNMANGYVASYGDDINGFLKIRFTHNTAEVIYFNEVPIDDLSNNPWQKENIIVKLQNDGTMHYKFVYEDSINERQEFEYTVDNVYNVKYKAGDYFGMLEYSFESINTMATTFWYKDDYPIITFPSE